MLIYQSRTNLDENNFVWSIINHLDPEIRKMLVRGMSGNKDPSFHSGPTLPAIEIKILFLKLAM